MLDLSVWAVDLFCNDTIKIDKPTSVTKKFMFHLFLSSDG